MMLKVPAIKHVTKEQDPNAGDSQLIYQGSNSKYILGTSSCRGEGTINAQGAIYSYYCPESDNRSSKAVVAS